MPATTRGKIRFIKQKNIENSNNNNDNDNNSNNNDLDGIELLKSLTKNGDISNDDIAEHINENKDSFCTYIINNYNSPKEITDYKLTANKQTIDIIRRKYNILSFNNILSFFKKFMYIILAIILIAVNYSIYYFIVYDCLKTTTLPDDLNSQFNKYKNFNKYYRSRDNNSHEKENNNTNYNDNNNIKTDIVNNDLLNIKKSCEEVFIYNIIPDESKII